MRKCVIGCRKTIISLMLLGSVMLPSSLHAEDRGLSVSASGSVRYNPDMAEFTVMVTSTQKDAARATAKVADLMSALRKALLASGIPAADIASSGYTVNPEWEWIATTKSRVLKGYTSTHVVRVTVRDLQLLGKAIDATVNAGAGNVDGLRYFRSRIDDVRREALALAVRSAKADAESIASAAGGKLGNLLELDYNQPQSIMPVMRAQMMEKSQMAPETEIVPGEQEFSVSVNSRWQFLPSGGK